MSDRQQNQSEKERVESLAAYSPEFNPIKILWSTIKSMLRLLPTQAIEAKFGSTGFETGQTNLKNWFTLCSYCTS
jgi:transposase